MKHLLLFIWQLPQNITGLILKEILFFIKDNVYLLSYSPDFEFIATDSDESFALGRYIFLGTKAGSTEIENQLHEHDQSVKWGPFYFIFKVLRYILWY